MTPRVHIPIGFSPFLASPPSSTLTVLKSRRGLTRPPKFRIAPVFLISNETRKHLLISGSIKQYPRHISVISVFYTDCHQRVCSLLTTSRMSYPLLPPRSICRARNVTDANSALINAASSFANAVTHPARGPGSGGGFRGQAKGQISTFGIVPDNCDDNRRRGGRERISEIPHSAVRCIWYFTHHQTATTASRAGTM